MPWRSFVRAETFRRRQRPTDVVANMQPVVIAAAEAGLAVGLYSIPDVSGLPMTTDVAAALLAGPGGERIVAIKVTEASYEASTLAISQRHATEALEDRARLGSAPGSGAARRTEH